MKFRYFIRGLGVGIVFAAIIFVVAYNSLPKSTLSDDEIIKRAKQLGMVEEDNKIEALINHDNSTENISTEINSDRNITEEATTENATLETTENAETTEATDNTENETKKEDTESVYEITVTPGQSSYPVCEKLRELGIIENAEEFDDYLIDNGYASKIAVGNHVLKKGMTYKEIAVAISDK